jgi:hypothetical protein
MPNFGALARPELRQADGWVVPPSVAVRGFRMTYKTSANEEHRYRDMLQVLRTPLTSPVSEMLKEDIC